jgi:hypothetical protein
MQRNRIAFKIAERWLNREKEASVHLTDAHLIKQMDVEETDCHISVKGHSGSFYRDEPPESSEVSITHATLKINDMSEQDAEKLPTDFTVQKQYTHDDDDGESIDLVLTFHVKVNGKKILPNKKVEIDYTDTFKDWDYD